MIKKIKDNFLVFYLIINIFYLYIMTTLCCSIDFIKYRMMGRSIIGICVISLIISIILFIKKVKINKDIKKSIGLYEILILIITILLTISSVLAINKKVAFLGFTGRYEGLFSLINYLLFMYISSYIKKDKKKLIVYAIIISGIYEALFAYLQILNISFIPKHIHIDNKIWATGSITNPNFFGSLMVLSLSCSIGLFIDNSKKLISNILLIVSIIILMLGLLISDTTSALVGLIVVVMFLLFYVIKTKSIKRFFIVLLILVLETTILTKLNMTDLVKDLVKTKNEVVELSKGNYDKHYGTNRVEIWRLTLDIVPKYLIHGAGIDNFTYAFGEEPLIVSYRVIDKAHNEYLQVLVTEGIFALISYLALYFISLFKGVKNSFKNKEVYLVLPVIGYLVQAFFNISVIEVAPIFYIILGLLVGKNG